MKALNSMCIFDTNYLLMNREHFKGYLFNFMYKTEHADMSLIVCPLHMS